MNQFKRKSSEIPNQSSDQEQTENNVGAEKRERKHSDDALSDYLAGLGDFPLYTAEQELRYAEDLKNHEVGAWIPLLDSLSVLQLCLRTHEESKRSWSDATEKVFLRHEKRLKRGAVKESRAVTADRSEMALALRSFDDKRTFIDEAITTFAEGTDALPEGGIKEDAATRLRTAKTARRHAHRVRNGFVNANLRLVVSVARRFHHYRMPLIDLIQEGNLGLIKAVHRYDHTKGFRFSTYAHWWIRQAVERSIMNKGSQIRTPVHIFDARREVAKATSILAQAMSREPTVDEIAELIGKPPARVAEVRAAVPREPLSLHDNASGAQDERSLGETIADPVAPLPDESVIQQDQAGHLYRIMKYLSPMEVDILRRRFGLDRDQDETLEQIGKSYSLSRERVRQLQIQGLKKMLRICQRRQVAL